MADWCRCEQFERYCSVEQRQEDLLAMRSKSLSIAWRVVGILHVRTTASNVKTLENPIPYPVQKCRARSNRSHALQISFLTSIRIYKFDFVHAQGICQVVHAPPGRPAGRPPMSSDVY